LAHISNGKTIATEAIKDARKTKKTEEEGTSREAKGQKIVQERNCYQVQEMQTDWA
jgi:hypothetical protein